MFIFKDEMKHEDRSNVRGGVGTLDFCTVIPEEQLYGAGTMFAQVTIPSGASIAVHDHTDNFEIYYVLEGKATVSDGGVTKIMLPGDAEVCANGNTHSIINEQREDLKMLAVILNNLVKK